VTSPDKGNSRVLTGVRVLDFGRVVAGPHCAQVLCAMGADVIKIERPVYGDDTRMDPYVFEPGLSAAFMQQNWGKRSLSIDLRSPEAKRIVLQLVAKSDVVVENFRPGVMERQGFSYDALSAINPRIIMCSISAFGQTGPYANRVGYGPIAEALAGIPELTGERDGPPMPTQYAIADNLASLLASSAICGALYWRDRSGLGQYIDISLLEAAFQGQDLAVEQFTASMGKVRITRSGRRDLTFVPWGFFEGKDGWVVIMCGNETMWPPLARTMGREDMIKDPRFDNFAHRFENRDEVYAIVEDWVRRQNSISDIVELMNQAGVPCDRVNTIEQAVNHPQVRARKLLVEREHPTLGKMEVVNSGLNFSRTRGDPPGHPPFLGEHNAAILKDLLSISAQDVEELTKAGVLYQDPRVSGLTTGRS
jgi:crotonobetainyl-CoA:carnitine CoA-transferase CaiB-like acyl-CoA transferase